MLHLNLKKLWLLKHQARIKYDPLLILNKLLKLGYPLLHKLYLTLPRPLLKLHRHHNLRYNHLLLLQVGEWACCLSVLEEVASRVDEVAVVQGVEDGEGGEGPHFLVKDVLKIVLKEVKELLGRPLHSGLGGELQVVIGWLLKADVVRGDLGQSWHLGHLLLLLGLEVVGEGRLLDLRLETIGLRLLLLEI